MSTRVRLDEFGKQLEALQRTLRFFKTERNEELRISLRSALIHDFELAFELGWKSGQELALAEGIRVRGSREAVSFLDGKGLVQDSDVLNDMIDGRNLTVHAYGDTMAEQMASQIESQYVPALLALYNALR